MSLLLISMVAMATAQIKAYSLTKQDVGYEKTYVATLSVDGMTVISFDQQFNIVDWQTPVTFNQEVNTASAQVVDAYSVPTPMGEVSMTLACYRWPNHKPETLNLRSNYTYNSSSVDDAYSFTSALTVI